MKQLSKIRDHRSWIAPTAWAAGIFASSCTAIGPRAFIHGVATATVGKVDENHFSHYWDSWWWLFVKGWHAFEFAVLFVLVQSALRRASGWNFARAVTWSAVFSVAYAASDEFHQTFVKNRGGKLSDVVIDSMGIAVAMLITLIVQSMVSKRSSTSRVELQQPIHEQ